MWICEVVTHLCMKIIVISNQCLSLWNEIAIALQCVINKPVSICKFISLYQVSQTSPHFWYELWWYKSLHDHECSWNICDMRCKSLKYIYACALLEFCVVILKWSIYLWVHKILSFATKYNYIWSNETSFVSYFAWILNI